MKHIFSQIRARYDAWKKTALTEPLQPDWRQIASESPPAWLPLVSWSGLPVVRCLVSLGCHLPG